MRHAQSSFLPSVFVILTGLLFSSPSHANETPKVIDGVTTIDSDDLKKFQSGGAVVIDARIAAEYAEAHIPGAISIPYHEQSEKNVIFNPAQDDFNISKLPQNRASVIAFYCNGPTCWKSYKSILASKKAGYTNIFWYRDGFMNWKEKGLPIE